jgi:colanic acid biosynthesis glycosyl transferase WcaI
MKFLIYGLNFYPELVGVGKYTGEMAQALMERGHKVSVVTAPPYYPQWKVMEGYQAGKYSMEQNGRLRVMRCPLWVPRRVTGLTRVVHLLSFALSSAPVLYKEAREQPDLIFAVAPAIIAAPAASMIGRLFGIHTWLHVQDFEFDAAFNLGMVKGGGEWLVRLARHIEAGIYRGFGRVSSVSPKMVERLKAKGVPAERCGYFPNWVDLEEIYPVEVVNPYRGQLGIGESCAVALYSGSMGAKHGLEVLVEAARELKDEAQVQFVLCGEGPAKEGLKKAAHGLDNVHFLSLQPVEKLNELLNLADIHLLPQRADAADLVMPSKVLGMMASGRPMIAGCMRETALYEIVSEIGLAVEPENGRAMAEAILRLAGQADERVELGLMGRAYAADHFSKDKVIDRFLEVAQTSQ